MSPAKELQAVQRKLSKAGGGRGLVHVHVVEAGDHGLLLTAKRRKELGLSQAEADDELMQTIMKWLMAKMLRK